MNQNNQEKYLTVLGKNFAKIREMFGWRQEDVGERIGISRSKVVAIENEPTKMSISEAQSLFVACEYELYKAKKILKEVKGKRNKKVMATLIASSVFITSPLFASSIIGLVAALRPTTVTKLIPAISGVFGSAWKTTSAKLKKEKQIVELTNEDMIDFSTLEKGMKDTIHELEQNLLILFELNEWNSNKLFEKLHPDFKLSILNDE
jgi:DNA-binding XRE family transcriptional regulator